MCIFITSFVNGVNLTAAVVSAVAGVGCFCSAFLIYDKGIKKKRDDTLTQLGIEFTLIFIIPFGELISALDSEFGDDKNNTNIYALNDKLRKKGWQKLSDPVEFPYWETHKGDIIDSLKTSRRSGNKSSEGDDLLQTSYMQIEEFVELANSISTDVKVLADLIYKYITDTENSVQPNDTFGKFLNNINDTQSEDVYRGLKMMKKMIVCIRELPPELKIREMTLLLNKVNIDTISINID